MRNRVLGLTDAFWHGHVSRNVGGAVGVQLCLLVSGTLSARLLGPENRGYVAILMVWPSAIGQFGAVGMSLAATYFLSSKKANGSDLILLLRKSACIQILALTVINAAIILGYVAISGAPIMIAACMSLAQLPAALILDYGVAFLLGARRHGAVSLVRVTGAAMYAVGMIVLYLLHRPSVEAVIAIVIACNGTIAAIALTRGIRAAGSIRVEDSIIQKLGVAEARKTVLRFGRKGYVGYLSPVDSFRIDQLVVGFLISPRALGIYVVGAAFTNFARLVATNIGLSATPEIAAQADPDRQRRAVQDVLVLAGTVLTVVTVCLSLFVIVAIPVLFGNSYRDSIPIAEILFVAGWFLSMKRVSVDAMRGAGEARVGARAEAVNLAIFLVACGPLGILFGGPGVAAALVFASAGGTLVMIRRLRQLGIIPAFPSSHRKAAALMRDA